MASRAAPTDRYSSVAIALHWTIALIVIANLAGGLTIDLFLDSPDSGMVATGRTIIALHKAFGLLVIALTLLRIGWRLANPPPPFPASMTGMERGLARTVHVLFYGLLLVLPLSGWAMVSTGKTVGPVSVFGWFDVPALPFAQAQHGLFASSHELLGWVMLATLALHILAAAKHQLFDRDHLLARMVPW
jgi:cytochrome b561